MSTKAEKKAAIFEAAIALESDTQREAYLERACPDEGLRREVAALIRAHDSPDSLIIQSDQAETLETRPLLERPGTEIGRYKLLQQIGEGGMGIVFMAEQTEPVRRKVALKIIKLGMDTKSVVARFEAERQALALMDHPNIAKVFDAGSTDTGRPYFVMELVKGVPISTYCDKNQLTTKDRLQLFIQVCQSIQHAHQKGVIHRDIKPSNILVTLHDGNPVPKVIDFGIAKATNQRLTEKTLFTNFAQMIGTPAYMSPEQAEMSGLDIDTRTDVYSLGVLLYELLTGTTPFPEKELLSRGYGEMQRIIAEQEPERPSLRMSTLVGEQQSIVTKSRAGDLPLLTRQLTGDLDWIVMKSLEKDRTRRYDTANGLAEDIRRHLTNEPVIAAKPSFRYQLAKLYYRHKPAFAAAAGIALALTVGTVIATAQAIRANEQANRATEAHTAALRAQEEAEEAQLNEKELRQKAQRETQNALDLAEAQQLHVYASDMRLADEAIKEHDYASAREILLQHRPADDTPKDLRGFEWRLLWSASKNRALKSVAPSHKTRSSEEASMRFRSWHRALKLSPNRKTVLVSRASTGMEILSYPDLKPQVILPPPPPHQEHGHLLWRWPTFSPDGSRLYVFALAQQDHQISYYQQTLIPNPIRWLVVYNTETWKEIAKIETRSLGSILLSDSGDPILLARNLSEDSNLRREQTTFEPTLFRIQQDGSFTTAPALQGLPPTRSGVTVQYHQFAGTSRIATNQQEAGHYLSTQAWTVYDTSDKEKAQFLHEIPRSFVTGYRFSPSGEFYANATSIRRQRVQLRRFSDSQLIQLDPMMEDPFTGFDDMVFTEDSQHLIAGDGTAGLLHVWSTETGERLGVIGDQPDSIVDMVTGGNHVACLYNDGQVRTWDWTIADQSRIPYDRIPILRAGSEPNASKGGRRVRLQIEEDGGSPAFLQRLSPELRHLFQEKILPWEIPYHLVSAWYGNQLRSSSSHLITPTGRYLGIGQAEFLNEDPEPNPAKNNNPTLPIYVQKARLFRFYDLAANNELVAEWKTMPRARNVDESESVPPGHPNILRGDLLLVPQEDHLELWDLRQAKRRRLSVDIQVAKTLRVSHTRYKLAVADLHRNLLALGQSLPNKPDRVLIWDIQEDRLVADLGEYSEMITGLRFSADGKRLFVGGKDSDALVISADTGDIITRMKGHRGHVWGEFSPDGRTLLTSTRNIHRLWNVQTGRKMLQFDEVTEYGSKQGHGYRFGLDGNRIYSGTSFIDESGRPYFKMVTVPTLAEIDQEIAQSL